MEENESESEYENEEAVVLVELNGIIDSNFLLQEQTPTKILGIETDQPILQIGHYIFSGEYEDTLGTVIAYEPVRTANNEGKETTDYKFVCKTDKKLSMKRVFVQERENSKTDESKQSCNDVLDAVKDLDNRNDTTEDSVMECSEPVDTSTKTM